MSKKESLAERLIRVSEEKVKIECENQTLRDNCVAWQKAYEGKANFLLRVLDDMSKCDKEKSKIRDENYQLIAYKHLVKLCFERCGSFIVKYSQELGVNDYLIKELGLDIYIADKPEEVINQEETPDSDDILSLFKQSSNSI